MTLGRILRERRIELGKSIEQISAATRIHARILTALEDDRYSDLPARTFTRGFITSYCKALRLDAEQILKDHHDFLEQKFTERTDRDQGHHGYVFEGKELEQNKRGMIIGATIAISFAVAVLLIFKPQNHKRKEKHKDFVAEDVASSSPAEDADSDEVITTETGKSSTPAPSPVSSIAAITTTTESPSVTPAPTAVAIATIAATPTPKPTTTPKPTSTPKPPATPKPSASPALVTESPPSNEETTVKKDPLNKGDDLGPKEFTKKIAFEATEDAFVKYRADDRPETQFILRKGKFLVIKAKEKIVFQTTKPEALKYRTKTRTYEILGKNAFSVGDDGSLLDL